MDLKTEMRRFGYTQKWFDTGLMSEDAFAEQVNSQSIEGDFNYEHYRYAAFNEWLKRNAGADDKAIGDYLEIALLDPDPTMAGGAVANLMDSLWITDSQFETVAAKLVRFGKWTGPRIERTRARREEKRKGEKRS